MHTPTMRLATVGLVQNGRSDLVKAAGRDMTAIAKHVHGDIPEREDCGRPNALDTHAPHMHFLEMGEVRAHLAHGF